MKLKDGIEHALNGNAVLFVGAGFCMGATNLTGKNFLTGRQLVSRLRDELGSTEDIDLKLASEMFVHKKSTDELISLLREQYTAKSISKSHEIIGTVGWKRVYTTNYDNVLEIAYLKNSRKLTPITLNDNPKDFSGQDDVCVHINGFIDQLNRTTLFDSFKLTNTSYLTDTFGKSSWAYLFRKELRQAQVVFFLGYSLYDIDITKILFEEPDLVEKCFFITESNPSDATVFTLEKYGKVLSEGIDGFSRYLEERKRSWDPARYEAIYQSFDEWKIPKTSSTIKDEDVFDLFLYGNEDRSLIWDSLVNPDDSPYYILRSKLNLIFDQIVQGKKTFLITSTLGNGKTLFCAGLTLLGLRKNYRVFWLNDDSYFEKEISTISQSDENVIVVIENYHRYIEKIRYLNFKRSERLVIFLTSRTEVNDIYYEELEKVFRSEQLEFINLDELDAAAIQQVVKVFNHYGLWGQFSIKPDRWKLEHIQSLNKSFQRILLELLNSPDIEDRFKELLARLKEKSKATELIVTASILTYLNYQPRLAIIAELLETNIGWEARFKNDPLVRQIADVRNGVLYIRSAIFAKFLLSKIPDSNLVINTIIQIAKRAEELSRDDHMYATLFRELVRFGNLQGILPESQRRPATINFYEALKNLDSTRTNPHFWLQYAIARLSFPDLDEAKVYFENAYSYASRHPNYDLSLIDNHYARYLLERAKLERNVNVAFELFKEAYGLLARQILKHNKHYPYRVASGFYDFYLEHFHNLPTERKRNIVDSCRSVLGRIEKLDSSIKLHRSVIECKTKLEAIMRDVEKSPDLIK